MRVSDYIVQFLTDHGVDTIFMITGGQAMYLNDAVFRSKKIRPIFMHHEQSAGMSAEAYGRLSGKLGVAMVTAGPASVNVLNGVVGAWTDSSPMMVISGQAPLSFVQYEQKTHIRQYGVQGINIRPLAEKVTKYFVTVDDAANIGYYMEKAYYEAFHGRPGPVWIDVPMDIQRMEIPVKLMKLFVPETTDQPSLSEKDIREVIRLLGGSKRPLIVAGHGVDIAGAQKELIHLVHTLGIPLVTTRLGIDIIPSDDPLYIGRPGTYGDRPANIAVQLSDFIIAVGSRLASAMVGHAPKEWGKNAKKVVVDIDQEELDKPGVTIDLKIKGDAKEFLNTFSTILKKDKMPNWEKWSNKCLWLKKTYPVVLPEYKKEHPVNSYYFYDRLAEAASSRDVVLVDTGSCFHIAAQAWKVKKNQRFMTTGGISTMGYWVAGIGACAANNFGQTFILTGDGSLQFNIQEFATIKHNKLPIKVFVLSNNGYLLIRHTQKNLMEGHLIGESPKTGVWCPDTLAIAKAYGIPGIRINKASEVEKKIQEVLSIQGPVICDIVTPDWQLIIPRTASDKKADGSLVARPYEDMFPYLDREEFAHVLEV
jgi:acetolactate synthase I/II/III large subunit